MRSYREIILFRVTVLTFISMGMVVGPALAQQILDDSAAKVGGDNAKAAMHTVMAKLKDPMSARFRSFAHPDPRYSQYPKKTVCGMVNAKMDSKAIMVLHHFPTIFMKRQRPC
jgi:hypothetical protein